MAALLILLFLGFDKWWFIRDRHRNLGGERLTATLSICLVGPFVAGLIHQTAAGEG